jgi:hypothetical protein
MIHHDDPGPEFAYGEGAEKVLIEANDRGWTIGATAVTIPTLDCSGVSSRLQWLRGPRTMEAGLAGYERHLGLTTRHERDVLLRFDRDEGSLI